METMVEIKHLNKWFDNFQVLKDISLSIKQGERVVICGPSGSGKSTLIRCINGLETFQKGNININGISLNDKASLNQARKKVGMVFQHFNLFPHLSAIDNCTLAPMWVDGISKQAARETALKYLERVGVADRKDHYPSQLSGGQQQRVAIARALCMQPEIVLFDEPTSALDPEMVSEVLDCMVELAESGMTMVCVSHEMGFARQVASRVLFMEEGSVLVEKDPASFFDQPDHPRLQRFLSKVLH
jgi:general L-amino acid transport system ATP-binding protein